MNLSSVSGAGSPLVPPVPAPTPDGQTGTQGREPHRVTWDEGHATFHCDAGPDAACRNYPSCECEVWNFDTIDVDGAKVHSHPDVPQETCWKLSWLTACDAEDTYCGDEPMLRQDGPIDTEWEGECLLWRESR